MKRARLSAVLLSTVLALGTGPLLADGVAWRVKDLRTRTSSSYYLGGGLTPIDLGAMVYLDFLNLGREPWITDGTLAGTRLMANLAPGSMGSDPVELGKVGATVFLAATTPSTGRELWRTNGRAWGTAQVMDIRPGPMGSDPEPLSVLDGAVLFVADDGVHGAELWRSDGTTAGTWLLADLWPGPESGFEYASAEGASEELDGRIVFTGRDSLHGRELWVTDGTAAGTHLLLDLWPGASGSDPWLFRSFGGRVYFSAEDPDHGSELWVTDGTVAGTQVLADLVPGQESSSAMAIGVAQHGLVFVADERGGSSYRPWVTDGTSQGTSRLAAIEVLPSGIVLGNRVLLTGNDALYDWEPWVTDGTPAGTRLVADIYPGEGGSLPRWGARGQGYAYFCADDTGSIPHLYRTNGSASGTRKLDGIECQWLGDAVVIGDGTLLDACWSEECGCPGCWCDVCRLWRTDGTQAGTWSLYPGARLAASSQPRNLTPRNGGIFFSSTPDLPLCGEPYHYGFRYPFVSDGTESGTVRVSGSDGSTVCSGESKTAPLPDGEVLFAGWQETTGRELWATDAAGAHLVRDIAEGPASSDPGDLTRVGPRVFLAASDPVSGSEPWISDGSPPGTSLLADLVAGAGGSYPHEFADVFGRAWFAAGSDAFGFELWESEGTAATTIEHDLTPGSGGTFPERITPLDEATGSLVYLSRAFLFAYVPGAEQASLLKGITIDRQHDFGAVLAVSGATLYFVDSTTTDGCRLWASDGTTAGTQAVTPVGSGYGRAWGREWVAEPCPTEMVAFGGRLHFAACDDTHGCELWTSDGTAAGTGILADLEPGLGSSLPWSLTVIGEKLYFAGCRAASGCEPWVSDGTAAGTHRVADIALGPPSSDPHDFTLSGRIVYFAADDTTGEELWAMPAELFYDGFETGDVSRWDPPAPPGAGGGAEGRMSR